MNLKDFNAITAKVRASQRQYQNATKRLAIISVENGQSRMVSALIFATKTADPALNEQLQAFKAFADAQKGL